MKVPEQETEKSGAPSGATAGGWEEAALKRLWRAGADGAVIGEIGGANKDRSAIETALAGLVQQGKVARFASGRRSVYFLAQFAPTLDSVRRKLQEIAGDAAGLLLSKDDLSAGLAPAERPLLSEALMGLVTEKWLVKLSHVALGKSGAPGRETEFYMHPAKLRELVAANFPADLAAEHRGRLLDVYRAAVVRNGFPDVEIFELHEQTGLPLDVLKEQIVAERNAGRAVLSFGDWSLASAEARAAAVEIDGERYLRVRLEAGDVPHE